MHTFTSALALIGADVPAHLEADAGVPILSEPQAQGDVLIYAAAAPASVSWQPLQGTGIRVVQGEAGGNTHWLHPGFESPGVRWAADSGSGAEGLTLGYVEVPEGQSALLIHTEEHGANGIGPGIYVLNRKREFARPAAVIAAGAATTESTEPLTWWQAVLD
jgi:hypothetical protein